MAKVTGSSLPARIGGAAMEWAKSPQGREMIAAALVAAATAISQGKRGASVKKPVGLGKSLMTTALTGIAVDAVRKFATKVQPSAANAPSPGATATAPATAAWDMPSE